MKVRCINSYEDYGLNLGIKIGKIYDVVLEDEYMILVNENYKTYKFSNRIESPWCWENFFERLRDKNLENLGI